MRIGDAQGEYMTCSHVHALIDGALYRYLIIIDNTVERYLRVLIW